MAEVKQISESHRGLFANKSYTIDAVFAKIEGDILDIPNRFTYQVGANKHISCNNNLKYINHNCYPNLKVENEQLVCIKPIQNGEELTFNYNDSESQLAEPFKCSCCDKWIEGKGYTAQ